VPYKYIESVTEGDSVTVRIEGYADLFVGAAAFRSAELPPEGTELDEEKLNAILDSLGKDALNYAVYMLALRPLSQSELQKRLERKGFDRTLSLRAVERLVEMGALDDLAYARQYAENLTARGSGPRKIAFELKKRGLPSEFIDEALEDLPSPEDKLISFIASRCKALPLDRKEAARISSALIRKGYSWEDIRAALAHFTDIDEYDI